MEKKEMVGTIEVEYDSTNEQEAEKIIEYLSKNYFFISDILGKINKISLINKNNFFVQGVPELKEKLKAASKLYIKNTLPNYVDSEKETALLKFLLLNKLNCLNNYSPALAKNKDLHAYINFVYSILATKYYTEKNTPEKLIEFILELSKEEKQNIFDWLNKRKRFDLFNYLLDEQYQIIIQMEDETEAYDAFLKNNLDELINIIEQKFLSKKEIFYDEQEEIINLPPLSKEDLDSLCIEFLSEIDPTLKWLEIYREATKKERIIYTKPSPDVEWCCLRGKHPVIIAPLTGTISDFRAFIHEFTHYIEEKDLPEDQNVSTVLREYAAIFLETIALKFLIKKGYSKDLICKLEKERYYWTQTNSLDIFHILQYIYEKRTEGPITLEKEQEKNKNACKNLPSSTPKEVSDLMQSKEGIENKLIKLCIDLENILLLTNPTIISREYPYIIGQYLSDKTTEKFEQNPAILNVFLNITENIINETPESVIKKLQLSTVQLNSKPTPFEYTKNKKSY